MDNKDLCPVAKGKLLSKSTGDPARDKSHGCQIAWLHWFFVCSFFDSAEWQLGVCIEKAVIRSMWRSTSAKWALDGKDKKGLACQ